ncbi:MAG TPA: hypothetical protein VLD59_03330 [Steroidobacteraceae bacterium]|nr:hypothetical protein [Steroidobacteraceae bacterium]
MKKPIAPRTRARSIVRCLLGLIVVQALVACGGGGDGSDRSGQAPIAKTPPTPIRLDGQGHLIGKVTIIDVGEYYGEALITADGAVRLYVGGPYVTNSVVEQARPASSAQFVGTLDSQGGYSGTGVVIGQGCGAGDFARFCGQTAFGEIDIGVDYLQVQGTIRVTTNQGEETWFLELWQWENYHSTPALVESVAGNYRELVAAFAEGGDVIVTIDHTGQLFAQSAATGCTVIGRLTPHLEAPVNEFDVSLSIDGCDAAHASLNGEFTGFATSMPSDAWAYDRLLRVWLSTREGTLSQTALTMLAVPLETPEKSPCRCRPPCKDTSRCVPP